MSEKLKEALEYWSRHIGAKAEAGSGRDRLAINDIGLFIEELSIMHHDLVRAREAVEDMINSGEILQEPLMQEALARLDKYKEMHP